MDNASYHSRENPDTKAPTSNSTKISMNEWLVEKNISFSDSLLKPELYKIVKEKSQYVVDTLVHESGIHKVLRLPPYHCDLNPIEMVWGIAKNKVAKENKVFKLDETKQLVTQALDSMQPSTFKACFKHTEKVENDYWTRDGLSSAPVIDSFVVNVTCQSDSSTETASESDQFDFSTDTANESEDTDTASEADNAAF